MIRNILLLPIIFLTVSCSVMGNKATIQINSHTYYVEIIRIHESKEELLELFKKDALYLCGNTNYQFKHEYGTTFKDAILPIIACRPSCLQNRLALLAKLTCNEIIRLHIELPINSTITDTSRDESLINDLVGIMPFAVDQSLKRIIKNLGSPNYIIEDNNSDLLYFIYMNPEKFIKITHSNTLFGKSSSKYIVLNNIPNSAWVLINRSNYSQ